MSHYAVIIEEGVTKALAPSGAEVNGVITISNEGPVGVHLRSVPYSETAPSVIVDLDVGAVLVSGGKSSMHDPTAPVDLGGIFGTAIPGTATLATVSIGAGQYFSNAPVGQITASTYTALSFVQPAVNANVAVTLIDGSSFSAFTIADKLYCAGNLYQFVSIATNVITVKNLGLAGSRVSTSAA